MSYKLHDDMTPQEAALIQRRLVEFSDSCTSPRNRRDIGIVLRDDHGSIDDCEGPRAVLACVVPAGTVGQFR